MKKIAFLFVLISTMAFSQKKCGYVNGLKEGNCITFYDNGQIWKDEIWKNGKLEGKYTAFHENGKLKAKGIFKKDMKVGEWVYYNDKGQKEGVEKHSNWKGDVFIDNLEITYYVNDQPDEVLKGTYINDLEEGIIRMYNKNGKLIRETNFVAGKKEGERKMYREDGSIEKIEVYKNDVLVSTKKP